jgi:nucleotide-binding universal stress UspA family protein
MIKNILVCTDGSNFGDIACRHGVYLAEKLRARLRGLHVLDSRMLEGPLLADISGWIGADAYRGLQPQFRDLMQKKGEAVAEAFRDLCARHHISAECAVKTGHPARVILEEEAVAELVIMGQKGEHAGWIHDMAGSVMERVIRKSEKPCLITPAEFSPVPRIVAGFDGSAHSGQALHEATELAQALAVELIVLTVVDNDQAERAHQVARDGLQLAEAHDVAARSLVVNGRAADALLETARAEGGALIVVGAYGHSRIREMILGSTTTDLIHRAAGPILLVR